MEAVGATVVFRRDSSSAAVEKACGLIWINHESNCIYKPTLDSTQLERHHNMFWYSVLLLYAYDTDTVLCIGVACQLWHTACFPALLWYGLVPFHLSLPQRRTHSAPSYHSHLRHRETPFVLLLSTAFKLEHQSCFALAVSSFRCNQSNACNSWLASGSISLCFVYT